MLGGFGSDSLASAGAATYAGLLVVVLVLLRADQTTKPDIKLD